MWNQIFLYTTTFLLISCNIFDVSAALTTFGRTELQNTTANPNEEKKLVAAEHESLESVRTEFKRAINELRQLIDDNKRDFNLDLNLMKTLILTQNEIKQQKVEKIENTAMKTTTPTSMTPTTALNDISKNCDNLKKTYNHCGFTMLDESNPSGVYFLHFAPLAAYCQRYENNNGWTVILRRNFSTAVIDSARYHNWSGYRNGFGNLNGDHWLGLETIHEMTKQWVHELWMQLIFLDGSQVNYRNEFFRIGSESESYALAKGRVDNISGGIGDILASSYEQKFSTYDEDHDNSEINCAQLYGYGWWYNNCNEPGSGIFGRTLKWEKRLPNGDTQIDRDELAYIQMAIRIPQ